MQACPGFFPVLEGGELLCECRPTTDTWEEAESALVQVRSQPWQETALRPAGYRLLTLRARILDTELVE